MTHRTDVPLNVGCSIVATLDIHYYMVSDQIGPAHGAVDLIYPITVPMWGAGHVLDLHPTPFPSLIKVHWEPEGLVLIVDQSWITPTLDHALDLALMEYAMATDRYIAGGVAWYRALERGEVEEDRDGVVNLFVKATALQKTQILHWGEQIVAIAHSLDWEPVGGHGRIHPAIFVRTDEHDLPVVSIDDTLITQRHNR